MTRSGIEIIQEAPAPAAAAITRKRFLNAGSGPLPSRQLHPVFRKSGWHEVRLDIDPQTKPDVVASVTNMSELRPRSFDAIWSSHSLEHLYAHEVPVAFKEFRRILKADGFALMTSPDLELVASYVLEHGMDHVAYTSPMGPITPRDMLFGHSRSIALGRHYMAHKTGFTCASLGKLLLEAGFPVALVKRDRLNLWAVGLMEDADRKAVQSELKAAGLDMFEDRDDLA